MEKNFAISIIGRPNVGKSTFFNRLVGRQIAIVDDKPGVTRDRKEANGNIGPYEFKVIDTAGLEKETKNSLTSRMNQQTEQAIIESDIVLFVVDGIVGITAEDLYYAKWLRKFKKKCFLIINKCENSSKVDYAYQDAFKLGFGEPICISAEHKLGFIDLLDEIRPYYDAKEQHQEEQLDYLDQIQLSIIGRPNAGKSTLINALLNEERTITGPEAGITRDAISIDWNYGDYKIKLVDTAGIRKQNKITDKVEKLSVSEAKRAINFSQIVLIVIDATCFLEQQDLSIIDYAVKEGRAVVVAANKWDLIKNKSEVKKEIEYQISRQLSDLSGIKIDLISASKKENLDVLMQSVIDTYNNWKIRISTSKLNNWVKEVTDAHPIPLNSKKKRPKIKFMTQFKSRPPTFLIHSNYPEDIDKTYQKYLINRLRMDFGMNGVPIRMELKKSDNPYS